MFSLECWHPAKMAFSNTPSGRVSEIGIIDGIDILYMLENAIIRYPFFDGLSGEIICTEFPLINRES